jgi:signal transduction histidine kinase
LEDAERIRDAGRDLLVAVGSLLRLIKNGESFALVRHDVRNTVGRVSGYAEILEDEVAPSGGSLRELKFIQSSAAHFLTSLDTLSALTADLADELTVVDALIHPPEGK